MCSRRVRTYILLLKTLAVGTIAAFARIIQSGLTRIVAVAMVRTVVILGINMLDVVLLLIRMRPIVQHYPGNNQTHRKDPSHPSQIAREESLCLGQTALAQLNETTGRIISTCLLHMVRWRRRRLQSSSTCFVRLPSEAHLLGGWRRDHYLHQARSPSGLEGYHGYS